MAGTVDGRAPSSDENAAWYVTGAALNADSDGSPRSYGPPGFDSLDFIGNATDSPRGRYVDDGTGNWKRQDGMPFKWVGVVVGGDGKPILNDAGGYVSPTSFAADPSLDVTDQGRYLDAEVVHYLATGRQARAALGVELGALAMIIDLTDGTATGAVLGDSGGGNDKGHEASPAVHQALGWPGDPKGGAQPGAGDILVIVFKGSEQAWPRPSYLSDAVQLFNAWGGMARVNQLYNKDFPTDGSTIAGGGGSLRTVLAIAGAVAIVAIIALVLTR